MKLSGVFNAVQKKFRAKKTQIMASRVFHLLAADAYLDNRNKVVQILRANPAARTARNDDGYTPLEVAFYQDKLDMVQVLLRAFPDDVNQRDSHGRTLLMGYATQGLGAPAQLLLTRNADITLQDNEGSTALHYAMKNTDSGFAAELLHRGAPVNAADNRGTTPLMLAAAQDDKNLLLSCLLLHKADLSLKDSAGQDATMIAIRWAAFDNAERLIKAGGKPDFDSPYMRHTIEAAQKADKQSFLRTLEAARPKKTDAQKKCAAEITQNLARGAGAVKVLKPVRFKN